MQCRNMSIPRNGTPCLLRKQFIVRRQCIVRGAFKEDSAGSNGATPKYEVRAC